MPKLNLKLYHPITPIHQCIVSYLDVYSISKNIAEYQGLHLMHLLFSNNSSMMMGEVEAKLELIILVVELYKYLFINTMNLLSQWSRVWPFINLALGF